MPDPIKDLYNSVKGNGLFVDENDFRTQLKKSPKEIYSTVSDLFVDYNDFENALGFKKKDVSGQASQLSYSPYVSPRPDAPKKGDLPLGVPNTQRSFNQELFNAKNAIGEAINNSDDILKRMIREERVNIFERQQQNVPGLDNFKNPAAASAKKFLLTQSEIKDEELVGKKQQAQQDDAVAREVIQRKKDPVLARSAYLVDAQERVVNNPNKEADIISNADKIARGELTYNIKRGVLQQPQGALESAIRGFRERQKQLDDYEFMSQADDAKLLERLEKDMATFDPDKPVPVPDGASAQFAEMFGMEGIPMLKSSGAAIATGLIPGAQGAAPFVAAAASSPEYYKRSYASALRDTYYQLRNRGKSPEEALKVARDQANKEGISGAAEGAISSALGAKIGFKPTSMAPSTTNALNKVVMASKDFIVRNAPEAVTDAGAASLIQVANNIAAIDNGLDRNVLDGVQENVAGELLFTVGVGTLTTGGRALVDPKTYRTILNGFARQPKDVVNAKIGEMVTSGVITPEQATQVGKDLENERALDAQIPSTVRDDFRPEITPRIEERNKLKQELSTVNEAFHPQIKDKIKAIDQEILTYATNESTVQEGPTEGNLVQPARAQEGQQEIGQGTGAERQGQVPQTNVGDSNIGSQGQVAGQELSIIERLSPDSIEVSSDATDFAQQMESAQSSLGRMGMSVSPYAQEDYDQIASEGGKFLRAAGNKVLSLLKPNGEMVSLVKDASVKAKGAAQAMISRMKDMGGLFMDNYDIYLTPIYEKAGYKVVARVPFNEQYAPEGWNAEDSPLKNKPDVVFMVRNDIAPEQAQTFTDYEEAQNYTQGLVDQAVKEGVAKLPTQMTKIDEALGQAIPMATQSLQNAGIKFQVVDAATDTDAARAARGNQGLFVSEDGTVIIDRSKLANDIEAGLVVWHEASHPVMNIIRNTNKPLYDSVVRGLQKAAKTNDGVAKALFWAKSQPEYDNVDTQNDEAVVETIARINSGLIDVSKLDTGLRQKLVDFVNAIAKYFGINPILDDTDLAAFKKTVSQVADALKTGRDIGEIVGQENVKEYMNNLSSPEIVAAGQLAPQQRVGDGKISVYESKEVSKLPVRSMQDIYDQFGGRAVAINSDPTRVGELTLPSGKKIFMYGGPAYPAVKDNVDSNVGFATTQLSKVAGWVKYTAEVFGTENGVTIVATQAPTSILSNSYALRYVMDAISMLPKGTLRSSEFKAEFFGKDLVLLKDAFGEKGYNEFVNKYKKADLSNPDVIDDMIAEMAYKVGDDNNPASFKARGAFVSNLLGGIALKSSLKGVEGDSGYVSKKPNKFIAKQLMDRLGINAEKVMREIGEPSLVDLYMNEGKWGMAVSGFESVEGLPQNIVDVYNELAKDPENNKKWKVLDDAAKEYASKFQQGGVKHPLFNAKFPGKNAFILDGAYEVNKMFKPIEMTGPKGGAYTKTAAQMLAGSMYVKGQPNQAEGTFEYGMTQPSGNRIQASVGNRGELLAPNGKPSNLTPKQYEQVRTPQFKKWFGDWENDPANASKVVDENGEPLVVYHGSGHVFDTFEQGISGSFFAKSIKSAETYGVDGSIYPVFLSIKNPALINSKGEQWREVKVTLNSITPSGYRKATLNTNEIVESLRGARFPAVLPDNDVSSPDGVVFKNIRDSVVGALPATDVYVSFKPNQIKSAIGNSGEFSTTDNRIQASVGNRTEDDLRGEETGKERNRALSTKFGALDPQTQAKIEEDAITYFQRPNKQTAKAVEEFIDGQNLVDMADYVLSNPDIPEVSKVWMAAEVAKRMNAEIAAATDQDLKDALTDKQAAIYNEFAKKATTLGQAVQAFIAFKQDPNAVDFFLPKIIRELKKKGLEKVTDDQKAEIVNLLKEVNSAADGIPKDKAIIKMSHYLGSIAPMKPMDVLQALWYAKILSGITTQSTNFFANIFNTAFELPAVALRVALLNKSPLSLAAGAKGFGAGIAKGAVAAADIMKTGVRSKEADKYFSENPLEYFTWSKWLGEKGKVLDKIPPLNFGAWKYVGRMLAATDALFSTANQEAIANMLAYAEAAGTPGGNNFKKAQAILGNTKKDVANAKAQATAEGFDPKSLQGRRRVIEIVAQGRKGNEEADMIGKRITMNYDPEGWTKPIFDAVVALQRSVPVIKMVIPFARIVANLTENGLNYTPLGLMRAATGKRNPFNKSGEKMSVEERIDLFNKFALGTTALVALIGNVGEDDDDWFEITAAGSNDPQKKYELQKGGWRPYTITFKDGTKISYKDWPIAGLLAGVGHIRDAKKYSFDDSTQMGLFATGFFLNFYDKSLLSGLQDFFGIFNVEAGRGKYAPETKASERAMKYAAQQVRSLAVSNLAQQTGKMYSELVTGDPQRDAKTFMEVIYRDLPMFNDGIRPIIDVFGDEVKYNTTERLTPITSPEGDKMIEWLNENKFFVGVPKKRNIINADGTEREMNDAEYYEFRKLAGQKSKEWISNLMNGIKNENRQVSEAFFDGGVKAARDLAYVEVLSKYGFK